jgi:membrane associated rhomboid family serine protease
MFAILLNPFALTSILVIPLPIFIIGWILIISDIVGLTSPSTVNHLAHLGGYGALLLIFFFLEFRERKKILTGFIINLVLLLLAYVLFKIYGVGFLM